MRNLRFGLYPPTPTPRATYDELYAAYRQVYHSLRGLYHTLNRSKGQAGE